MRQVPHLDLVSVRPAGAPVDPAAILAQPTVASVHDLGRFQADAVAVPADPGFAKQWNLPLIQVPEAWAVSRGRGATVAVLDTGVAYEAFGPYEKAPDLEGTRFVAGHDFVDGDDHPNDDIDPAQPERPAHGTHSAGIIAETADNGVSGAGVAPEASIMPVRVLSSSGAGNDDQIAAGIIFAVDHGAQVLNMSFDSPMDRPMTKAAVTYAASKGATMVAATGNTGRAPVGYPAAYPEVIAVGAVRIDRTRPAYSTYGALGDVDLVAPGGDMSVDQDGDGAPDGIVSQSMAYATNAFGDQAVEGTSAAAPHVAGVAALLIGSGLATTADAVRQALVASASDLGPPGPDAFYGAGLVQARAALTAAGAPPGEPTPPAPPPTAAAVAPAPTEMAASPPSGLAPTGPPTPAGSRPPWGLIGGGVVVVAGAGLVLARRRSAAG